MTGQLTSGQLETLSARIADRMGLRFGPDRWQDMASGVEKAGRALGFADPGSWVHRLTTEPLEQEQIEVLAAHLTIGETYFMREPAAFDALRDVILPALMRRRGPHSRRLRFWSVGCCTGEEAYSIAITLLETVPHWKDWEIFILATDINPLFLEKARCGVFGPWSFRDVPARVIEKYFQTTNQRSYEIIPEIKRMVHFAYHNLAGMADALPGGEREPFDVVFCRNVLMYFDVARQRQVIGQLFESLAAGGWFMPGLAEISMAFSPPFEFVTFPEAIFCQKGRPTAGLPHPIPTLILPHAALGAATLPPQSHFCVQEGPLAAGSVSRDTAGGEVNTKVAAALLPALRPASGKKGLPPGANTVTPLDHRLKTARSAFESKRFDEVIQLLAEPANPEPPTVEVRLLLARAYANRGRLVEALERVEGVTATDKLNVEAHFIRALILQEQGDIAQAQAALNRVLYLDPNHIQAHVNQGRIGGRLGKPCLSRHHLRHALELLEGLPPEHPVPDSDGLTASQFVALLRLNHRPT